MCATFGQIRRYTICVAVNSPHECQSLRKLQIINVGLRQIAERVAGIEDQRTKLSDHRVIEFRMIGQHYDQIH